MTYLVFEVGWSGSERRERFGGKSRRCGRAYLVVSQCDSKQIWYLCDTGYRGYGYGIAMGRNFPDRTCTRHTRGPEHRGYSVPVTNPSHQTIVTPVLVAFVALARPVSSCCKCHTSTRISLPADARSETSRVILVVRNVGWDPIFWLLFLHWMLPFRFSLLSFSFCILYSSCNILWMCRVECSVLDLDHFAF